MELTWTRIDFKNEIGVLWPFFLLLKKKKESIAYFFLKIIERAKTRFYPQHHQCKSIHSALFSCCRIHFIIFPSSVVSGKMPVIPNAIPPSCFRVEWVVFEVPVMSLALEVVQRTSLERMTLSKMNLISILQQEDNWGSLIIIKIVCF